MTNTQEIQPRGAEQPTGSSGYDRSLKFAGNSEFQVEIRRRIDEFFRSTGRRQRDCPQMYVKTAILITSFIVAYVSVSSDVGRGDVLRVAAIVIGIVLSVVFQLAHCVEQAQFPLPQEDTGRIENSWAIHQVETSVDFARRSRVAAWLLGGLNFQIEHHLFPRICHVNYPAISEIVEQTCQEFGARYGEHQSFWSGVASHFRWLRRMGMADTSQ